MALLGVTAAELPDRLTAIGWRYHLDSAGQVWATEQTLPGPADPSRS